MYGIDRKIRFQHRVMAATWSSQDARWTLEVSNAATGETVRLTCSFLFLCSGYYDYAQGYTPDLPVASGSAAASFIPSSGRPTSTTPASASW